MNLYTPFLYLFSGLAVIFAVCVISMKNAVRSAVFLIFTILCISGIFFMLNAEFLGAIQILVYAGGIMVLYLFIIFLIRIEVTGQKRRPIYIPLISIFLLFILAVEIVYLLINRGMTMSKAIESGGLNLKVLSNELLKTYVIPFELASLLLIGALVATIYLARKKTE